MIEFFINYWDWYLLIGLIVYLTNIHDKYDELVDYRIDMVAIAGFIVALILLCIFWPIHILSRIFSRFTYE